MPSLPQHVMGFTEVARATRTPGLSIQHRPSRSLPPRHGADLAAGLQRARTNVEPAAGSSASRGWAGGAAWGVGRTHPAPAAPPRRPPQASSFPTTAGLWPPASAQRGTLGHRAIYLALWPPFLGPLPSSLQEKPHFIPQLPPACTPHPVPCAVVGPRHPRRVRSRWSAPFLPLSLGCLGTQLWKHRPAPYLVCGSHFFRGS